MSLFHLLDLPDLRASPHASSCALPRVASSRARRGRAAGRRLRTTGLLVVASLLSSACAGLPAAPAADTPRASVAVADAPAPADCTALGAAIGAAEHARQSAVERQQQAWRAIVPFAVAGRYASATHERGAAEARLAELRRAAAAAGCTLHALAG